jgi:hypothetical protein
MKDFMGEVIDLLISNNKQEVINVYNKYCKEILTLTDITPYCSKKTITTSVVNPSRTNEQKVLDALHGQQVSMGDKIYLYYAEETREETYVKYRTDRKTKEKIEVGTATRIVTEFPLRLREEWNVNAPDHSVDKLLKRLYDTLIIFKNVINIDEVPKYYQKGHKAELEKMVTNGI